MTGDYRFTTTNLVAEDGRTYSLGAWHYLFDQGNNGLPIDYFQQLEQGTREMIIPLQANRSYRLIYEQTSMSATVFHGGNYGQAWGSLMIESASAVPEPTTPLLLGFATLAWTAVRRRRA